MKKYRLIIFFAVLVLALFRVMFYVNSGAGYLPKVSVIVPVYNSEQYLSDCLNSLKKQTLREIEFIVINDGSSDKSFQLMQKFAKGDKRFRIFEQENKGIGKTRNRGMLLAKGQYVGFVDSDDYVSSNYFEKLYNKAQMYDADVVIIANVMKFDRHHWEAMELLITPYVQQKVLTDISFLVGVSGQQWDKIYKKEFLETNGIKSYEGRLWFEDEWFSTLTAVYARKAVVTDETIYYYRYNPKGITASLQLTAESFSKGLEFYDQLAARIEFAGDEPGKNETFKQRLREKKEWFKRKYENGIL